MNDESYDNEKLTGKYKNKNHFRIPKLYKDASKILSKYVNKEGAIQTLIHVTKHNSDLKRLLALLLKVVHQYSEIEKALNFVKLFEEQPRFDRSLAFILTSEICRTNGPLSGVSKPVEVINSYEEKLRDYFNKNGSALKETTTYNKDPFYKYVRINTHLISKKEVYDQLTILGWNKLKQKKNMTYDEFLNCLKTMDSNSYMKDYHIPNLLVFPPHQEFWQTDLYINGCILLQDKASCLPAFLSNVQPGITVIDACASPGNKTSHLADIMNGEGRLIAIDKDRKRYQTMVNLLKERGVTWVETLNCDFTSCSPADFSDVKVILVDPSCSSSGTNFHGDKLSEDRISRLASFQMKVLEHALSFPNVETVVYSTCSINEEENENVVEKALNNFGHSFHLEDLKESLSGWKHFGDSKYEFGHKCLRTNSSIDRCHGFFVAKFVRTKRENISKKKKSLVNESVDQDLQASKKIKM